MKMRDKNAEARKLIEGMHRAGIDKKSPLLKSLAGSLNRPRRIMSEVNLTRIEKHAKPQDAVAVVGTVLGIGEIRKPVNVFALRFSSGAREKIEKAGGKCMPLGELVNNAPKGVKILG